MAIGNGTSRVISLIVGIILSFFGREMDEPQPLKYVGSYKLTAVYDEQLLPIVIPTGDYLFTIKNTAVVSNSYVYDFSIVLGNTMGGPMTVTLSPDNSNEDDAVKFGNLFSTLMMPPEDVYTLEIGVASVLGAAETIQLTGTDEKILTIDGTKGKMEGIQV